MYSKILPLTIMLTTLNFALFSLSFINQPTRSFELQLFLTGIFVTAALLLAYLVGFLVVKGGLWIYDKYLKKLPILPEKIGIFVLCPDRLYRPGKDEYAVRIVGFYYQADELARAEAGLTESDARWEDDMLYWEINHGVPKTRPASHGIFRAPPSHPMFA